MILSKGKSKIVGLMLGEFSSTVLPSFTLRARYVLMTSEGNPAGEAVIPSGWSEKTITAYGEFLKALEEEAVSRIFDTPEGSDAESVDAEAEEPKQF